MHSWGEQMWGVLLCTTFFWRSAGFDFLLERKGKKKEKNIGRR
jgi:hypothetical protein